MGKFPGYVLLLSGIFETTLYSWSLYKQETEFGSWFNPSPTRWIFPAIGIVVFALATAMGALIVAAKRMPPSEVGTTQ
jgi:hypothetical protein